MTVLQTLQAKRCSLAFVRAALKWISEADCGVLLCAGSPMPKGSGLLHDCSIRRCRGVCHGEVVTLYFDCFHRLSIACSGELNFWASKSFELSAHPFSAGEKVRYM